MGNQTQTDVVQMIHDTYNVNESVVMYIIHTTDLHVVTHQLYMNQWMTDVLHTTYVTLHQHMKECYVSPTKPELTSIMLQLW